MTQQNILEAAKQGNPQAIAALLNRNLQPKGITVKVTAKPSGVLQILLESAHAPDDAEVVQFIQQGMAKLQPDGVRSLVIFGRSTGEELPDWKRDVDLIAQATPPPVPKPEAAVKSVSSPVPVKAPDKKPMPLPVRLLVSGAIAFWPAVILLRVLNGPSTTTRSTAPITSVTAPSAPVSAPVAAKGITMENYNRISTGMSYSEVVDILGQSGEEMSRNEIADTTTVMYMWQNPGGSNMNAIFQNDALVQKAQFGLP